MLLGVCVGTNDLQTAGCFYDQVLATIGMRRRIENSIEIGFASNHKEPQFWVLLPFNKQAATAGNGCQVTFMASSREDVVEFYDKALLLGGSDEGGPGIRDYRPGYFGAYCRDLDGNKLHVFVIEEQQA